MLPGIAWFHWRTVPSRPTTRTYSQEELRSVRTQPPPGAKYAWPGPETIGGCPVLVGAKKHTKAFEPFGFVVVCLKGQPPQIGVLIESLSIHKKTYSLLNHTVPLVQTCQDSAPSRPLFVLRMGVQCRTSHCHVGATGLPQKLIIDQWCFH